MVMVFSCSRPLRPIASIALLTRSIGSCCAIAKDGAPRSKVPMPRTQSRFIRFSPRCKRRSPFAALADLGLIGLHTIHDLIEYPDVGADQCRGLVDIPRQRRVHDLFVFGIA